MSRKCVLVGLVLVGLVLTSAARADGNSGEADDKLEFGAIQTFGTQSQAQAGCGQDVVVWADRYAGIYFFAREKEFGTTRMGAFACLKNAKAANYWSDSPLETMGIGHGKGREFPESFSQPTS